MSASWSAAIHQDYCSPCSRSAGPPLQLTPRQAELTSKCKIHTPEDSFHVVKNLTLPSALSRVISLGSHTEVSFKELWKSLILYTRKLMQLDYTSYTIFQAFLENIQDVSTPTCKTSGYSTDIHWFVTGLLIK